MSELTATAAAYTQLKRAVLTPAGIDDSRVERVNVKFSKPSDTPWLRFMMRFASSSQIATGTLGIHRTVGVLMVQVNVPVNKGDAGMALCTQIKAAFRGLMIASESMEFYSPVILEAVEADGWSSRTVSVDFRYDEQAAPAVEA